MANTKISQLTPNTNPNGGEELVYAYNNTNGKMTLNTMKTFASSGSQPTLVSGTNIKTINGYDILGSGNLVISGGGGGGSSSYDAIVDASGNGDYTLVSAAIAAGKYNLFVRNGNYTETEGWNPYANNKSFLHIVGESEGGVKITFPSTATTAHGYFIDMRYGNAADFYMENISFDITLTTSNADFYRDNGGTNFIVKNCSFTYDTTVTTPTSTKHTLFTSKVISEDTTTLEQGRTYAGLYGCYFNTETTKIINICKEIMIAKECKFYSAAGRIQLVVENYLAKLYNCIVNAYELGGTYLIEIYDSYVKIAYNVYDDSGNELEMARVANSVVELGTLQNTPTISLGDCTDSELKFGAYNIAGVITFGDVEGDRTNSKITCGQYALGNTIGCNISATSLKFSGGRVLGNVFKNTLTTVTINNANNIVNGNIFDGTGTLSITGNTNVLTSNIMGSMSVSDTGTGNQKANNITA